MMPLLSIIIPAYNEEKAISNIIQQCIEAKDYICGNTSVSAIELIVVNDGSKDGTSEIARKYKILGKIILVSYKKNRGYGAAIKRGFRRADGDYVAFLDADGTCDPRCFVDLVNNLEMNQADISIGSRMGPNSEMPPVRRLGNLIYAILTNLISMKKVTDTASGMRVIRKSSLGNIYPLPDGMHFTPAMSAKGVFNDQLKIVETFIPYKERIGESKLNVIKDGYEFLKIILEIGLYYKPLKFFFFGSFILVITCLYYGIPLVSYYLNHKSILETDIYRIMSILVMSLLAVNFLLLGITADEIVSIFSSRSVLYQRIKNRFLKTMFYPSNMILAGIFLIFIGGALNYKTLFEYILYQKIDVHWVYVIIGGFIVLVGAELIASAFIQKLLMMYKVVLEFRKNRKVVNK